MTDRCVVAIGCSPDRDYSFLIPFTALLWREHIGHHPLIFLVGNEEIWRSRHHTNATLQALDKHQISREFVFVENHPAGSIAQNARHHAAAVESIFPETWIMLADADLWPIARPFYHQHETFAGRAVCLYSNGDHFSSKHDVLSRFDAGGGFQSIPTCHVTMRAKDWREIYEIIPGDVSGSTKKTFEKMEPWLARCSDQNLARWCCDQWYVTERLCRQPWFPSMAVTPPCPPEGRTLASENVLFVERYGHPPLNRMDRSIGSWKEYGTFDISRWTDAHVHKNPTSPEHWADELRVIQALLPHQAKWAQTYYDEYTKELT